ncbi:MAG: hypothetical protein AAF108_01065 [Planctomycetota bacterium]
MRTIRGTPLCLIFLVLFLGVSGGCRSADAVEALASAPAPPPTRLTVPPGAYADAFRAVTRRLSRDGWMLDRIDAGAGEISTGPRRGAGLLTPFTRLGASLGDEVRETVQGTERRVRVSFRTPEGYPPSANPLGPMTARVDVLLSRVIRPGRRLSPVSIRLSSVARDPLRRRPPDPVSIGRDVAVEQELAERFAESRRPAGDRDRPLLSRTPPA